jgi:hypothetical protein
MPAASIENAASQPEALLGPPAKSKATPVPHAPSADSPNPTVECSAIVAPRWARIALALMPDVNAPESPETVNPYTSRSSRMAMGENVAVRPIARAVAADTDMIVAMARCRPKRSAASLPSTLAGSDSNVNKTLIATGPKSTSSALRAVTNVQN